MASCGDRFCFKPNYYNHLREQEVSVVRLAPDDRFWCKFRRDDDSEIEILCCEGAVPGYGVLEAIALIDAKQHDLISLDEWRAKARSKNWPRSF